MPLPVVAGATCICTMGATGQLNPSDVTSPLLGGKPSLNITDSAPLTNIGSCGLCRSLANPTVASATAGALGVLTPMPCVPAPAGIWMCSNKVTVNGKPLLTTDGKIACAYGGNISILNAGQQTVSQK